MASASTSTSDYNYEHRAPLSDALLCKVGKKKQYGKQQILTRLDRDYQNMNRRFSHISSIVGENIYKHISNKEDARQRLRAKHAQKYGSSRNTN
tara:strand:+ start:620 stop:901 length:282 start_codon:yes stop_codon:yes gene_type:complete